MKHCLIAILSVMSMAGCANLSTQPPGTPTPEQISVFGTAVVATNLNPAEYLSYGLTEVERNCATWFGDQVAGARATSTGQQILSMLGTAAGATGTPIGAGVAAATSLGNAALGAAQSNAPGGAMPAVIYTLVQKQLRAYVAALPAPKTVADSAALIEAAAEYCQGPMIAGAVVAAVTGASVATVWAPANFSAASTASRVVPPVVVVGTPSPASAAAPTAEPSRSRAPVSRPRVKPSATEEPRIRPAVSMLRLIDGPPSLIDPEAQRKADEEWRATIGAWLARGHPQVQEPPPAPTLRPPPEEMEIEIIAPAEPPQAPPAATAPPRRRF